MTESPDPAQEPEAEPTPPTDADATAPDESVAEKPAASGATPAGGYELPPANFTTLATTLASQAMVAFGQFPGPDGKQAPPDIKLARHFIDTLEMLGEKTTGNLEAAEAAMLENILRQLRMTYIAVKDAMKPS